MVFKLVEVLTDDVPADYPGACRPEGLNRADVPGAIDHDGVARVDKAPDEEVQALLSAGDDEDILRLVAESTGDGIA
jgi:hypothetical protein